MLRHGMYLDIEEWWKLILQAVLKIRMVANHYKHNHFDFIPNWVVSRTWDDLEVHQSKLRALFKRKRVY